MDDRSLQQNQISDAGTPPPDQTGGADVNAINQNTANLTPQDTQNQAPQNVAPRVMPPQQNTPQAPVNDNHAGLFRQVFTALAGPRVHTKGYSINPNTGALEPILEENPSTGSIAKGIVAGAITGMLAGAKEKGPGSVLRSVAAGGQAVYNQNAEKDQQMQQEAVQAQNTHVQAMENNFRMLNNAIQLGRLNREDNEKAAESYKTMIDDWQTNAPDSIIVPDVDKNGAKQYANKGYQVIPNGKVIDRLNADGTPVYLDSDGKVVPEGTPNSYRASDMRYAVIDPSKKVPLSDENGAKAWLVNGVQKWGGVIPQLNDKMLQGGGPSGSISAYSAGKLQHQIGMLDATQSELDNFVTTLNEGRSKKDQVSNISLKKALLSGELSVQDVQNFQRSAAYSTQPDVQIQHMLQDPAAAASASKFIQLFGINNLQKLKEERDVQAATAKAVAVKKSTAELLLDENDAKYVIAHKGDYPPEKVAQAQSYLDTASAQSASVVKQGEEARIAAEDEAKAIQDAKIAEPDNYKYNPDIVKMTPADAKAALKSQGVYIPTDFEALYNVGVGYGKQLEKAFPSRVSKGTAQTDADHALTYITRYLNPNFRDQYHDAAKKFITTLSDPKQSPTLAAQRASQHLGLLEEAFQQLHNGNIIRWNQLKNIVKTETGDSAPTVFKAISHLVNTEVAKAAAGTGAPLESELKKFEEDLNNAQSPDQVRKVVKGYLGLMEGNLTILNNQSKEYFNRPLSIDENTNKMFKKYGVDTPWADIKAYIKNKDGNVVGYVKGDGKIVRY